MAQQQQQKKQQHMTKAYHETEIKIQICLAERVYSVKPTRTIIETLGLQSD